ncbi:recombinase family protein [Streptomyces sp. NPDC026659]|uniref:recombinase family protein n=1 Tax=Streptomyces sp. NPDC026659 TaxID=3155123 RepID=UPI003400F26C
MATATTQEPSIRRSADKLNVAYDRVSLDEQKTGRGTDSQNDENEAFALDTWGRPLDRRYSDVGISAYSGVERPDFNRLCRDMVAGVIGTVTVWHADRLTRDPAEALMFIELCIKHGVRLYSVQRGGEYNFRRAQGKADFLHDIVDANKESAHKGERVALARLRQARNGEWGGGVRAYGWGVDTGRVTNRCINPKAPIAERVYEERPVLDMTQHNGEEAEEIQGWETDLTATKGNVSALIRTLHERGVLTVSAKDKRKYRRGNKEFEGGNWSGRTVKQILLSPRVSGHAVYRGEIVKYNAFPPIIPDERRKALIVLLNDPARRTAGSNVPKWFGSLIYECPHCTTNPDEPVTCTVRKSATAVDVYRCKKCGRGRQSARLLDAFMNRVVIARLSRPDIADLVKPVKDIDLDSLREELAEIEARKTELAEEYGRKELTMAEWKTARATLNARVEEINSEMVDAVQDDPLAPFAANHAAAAETWQGLSLARRREILRLLYRIELKPVMRRMGRRPKGAPAEELDLSKLIITPKVEGARPIDLSPFMVRQVNHTQAA